MSLTVSSHKDFNRLWTGLAISQVGSAIGNVALPIVAVMVLHASTFQVALLAACAAVTTVLIGLPMGSYIEFRRKRPVMIGADVARFVMLASVPAAAALGILTFAHLCLIAVVNTVAQIAFMTASQANLVNLVTRERLVDANGRLQSTTWLSMSVGPSAGGVIVGFMTALGALLLDAVSFLVSAVAVWRIQATEPEPPQRDGATSRSSEVGDGMRYVWRDQVLLRLLISWILFAGFVGMFTPLETVFYLRDLHFSAWQYGLLMGLPSIAGFLGSRQARWVTQRFGMVRGLWLASMLRGPWNFLIPLAMPGTVGLIMCGVGFAGVLFFSALANSIMVTYRQLKTPDSLMSRVSVLWSVATAVGQPVFIIAGGLLASVFNTRLAIVIATLGLCASGLILSARDPDSSTQPRKRGNAHAA